MDLRKIIPDIANIFAAAFIVCWIFLGIDVMLRQREHMEVGAHSDAEKRITKLEIKIEELQLEMGIRKIQESLDPQ